VIPILNKLPVDVFPQQDKSSFLHVNFITITCSTNYSPEHLIGVSDLVMSPGQKFLTQVGLGQQSTV